MAPAGICIQAMSNQMVEMKGDSMDVWGPQKKDKARINEREGKVSTGRGREIKEEHKATDAE
jgi:hypothetical protein